jgi:flavin reductase (DIM6/NTAB) family NADH-FMN oxidoreductase RutF
MSGSPHTSIDPKNLNSTSVYKLLIGTIVPRPIAFVSTLSKEGIGNLAPFSFFNGVGSAPPSLMFSIARRSNGVKKDTLTNIESTQEFVVNFVSESIVKQANQCSADYPYGVDEMIKVGLTPIPSFKVKPKRVLESPVHMECKLITTLEVGNGGVGSATIVVGEIVQFHISNQAYDANTGRISVEELKPVARLAGLQYATTKDCFEIPRPVIS